MKPKFILDLHGVKHQDVEHTLENFFLWENNIISQSIQVITGNSNDMQKVS